MNFLPLFSLSEWHYTSVVILCDEIHWASKQSVLLFGDQQTGDLSGSPGRNLILPDKADELA